MREREKKKKESERDGIGEECMYKLGALLVTLNQDRRAARV